WYYGIAKPFGFNEVKPISEFVSTYSSSDSPIILTGDVYYTACIFFKASLHGNNGVSPEPLDKDAIALYYSLRTGETGDFLTRLRERDIEYLLIVDNGKPISGSAWGYQITPPKSLTIEEQFFNVVFNDGRSKLFGRIK
ncbi:MAG: hypothetical protein ACETVN_04630, partial [Asgard group archaeon]